MNVGRSAVSACAVTAICNANEYSFHGNETLTHEDTLVMPSSIEEKKKYARTFAKWRTPKL